MNTDVLKILEKAYAEVPLTKAECMKLLALEDASQEAIILRSAASDLVRKYSGNAGVIFGQIGLECHPCDGNCSFCSFAKEYTGMGEIKLDEKAIADSTKLFTQGDDLYGLYLMTMADYDLQNYLKGIEVVKANLTGSTKLYTNIGDTSYEGFAEIKAAGVDGVYHCWRLGEGRDTKISPERRKETVANAKKAGLDFLDALEPIGPEHTPEEMAEHILYSIEMGSIQCGAMRRISVPGTPFEGTPQISNFALSKYVAVVAVMMASNGRMPWMGTHEPNLHSYLSGANMITAETGVNPRDTAAETLGSRGWDVVECKKMLKEAGYKYFVRGDGSKGEL